MYSRIRSAVCVGMEGRTVYAETDIARGLPGIGMVGLPSAMVMESRERIKSAIVNSGFDFPRGRITVNLTPASLRKDNSCLDLPIALGILASGGSISPGLPEKWGMIGELALDGRVLGVRAALPMMLHMIDEGIEGIIVPDDNMDEAYLAGGNVFLVRSLRECIELIGKEPAEAVGVRPADRVLRGGGAASFSDSADFGDIAGQESAKRAVVVAAAGRHGLLMVGSPGCGKTMIAGRMPGVMPSMSERESLEAAIVRSACGSGSLSLSHRWVRPFRSPHHSIGRAGLIGGGLNPVPGEITMAHNGVLFLDEICEFHKDTIESLRVPMEEKRITHFRKGEAYTFPCNFQILMAANPCPCGYLADPDRECTCTQADLERYRRKLSGPIMDRIDMKIAMEKVGYDELTGKKNGMNTAKMKSLVAAALSFAESRGRSGYNSELSEKDTELHCRLKSAEKRFMNRAYESLSMSPRSYIRVIKVARTIADLDESADIEKEHLAEALSYRLQE